MLKKGSHSLRVTAFWGISGALLVWLREPMRKAVALKSGIIQRWFSFEGYTGIKERVMV